VLLKRGPHRTVTEIGRALHTHCERIAAIADASQITSNAVRRPRLPDPFGLANTWLSRAWCSSPGATPKSAFPHVSSLGGCQRRALRRRDPHRQDPQPELPVRRLAVLSRGLFAPQYCAQKGIRR
jgi:hypothetical protein